MPSFRTASFVCAVAMFVSLEAGYSKDRTCEACATAQYWNVPPNAYEGHASEVFPESSFVAGKEDVGVAFSGGGTRSATAAAGQLRGLEANGWLTKVKYMSAVSGGAWAATIFTYAKLPTIDIVGPLDPLGSLTVDTLTKVPRAQLPAAIVASSLLAGSIRESSAIFVNQLAAKNASDALSDLVGLLRRFRREANRDNKTYARLLEKIFIDGVLEPGTSSSGRWFTLDGETAADDATRTGGQVSDFIFPHAGRPFLIVTGTAVSSRRDYVYPLLMPVEYTPMYVGIRQRFGQFGGTYVSPWAYDSVSVGGASAPLPGHIAGSFQVHIDSKRRLTLGDMIASTGAAPQLFTILGGDLPDLVKAKLHYAAAYFPSFHHITVRDDGTPLVSAEVPHADGGAGDNLGITSLLARGVHNVLLFVNTSTRYAEDNSDLKSLFFPVGPADAMGDHTSNVVFPANRYRQVAEGLSDLRDRGEPQVYCGTNWSVVGNAHFNIAPYDGVNICFFYNAPAIRWKTSLLKPVRDLFEKSTRQIGRLNNFPWFETFEQNKPSVIKLTAAQVNLLANLTSWIVTDPATKDRVVKAVPTLR